MSNTYRPLPWQSPTKDGAQRPMSMQVDVRVPADASSADRNALVVVAHGIVQSNGSLLDRFIANNRQQVSISGRDYHTNNLTVGNDLRARYHYNGGQEKLFLDVYPTGGMETQATTTELNLDGYIAWIHGEGLGPRENLITPDGVPLKPSPYMIILNGYQIEKDFLPKLQETHCAFYPILFGRTAMLCGSQQDKEKKNFLLKEKTLKPPNTVIPPQGWGKYPDGSAPDGTDQSNEPKYLGYWLFDWENAFNPWQYTNNKENGPDLWLNWASSFMINLPGAYIGIPKGTRGCYFRDAQKSPLKPKGQNKISILDATPAGPQIVTRGYDLFIGEFYDRGKFRVVSQSWTHASQPRTTIKINDSPLIYGIGYLHDGYASSNGGMKFDLAAATTKAGPKGSYDDALIGPHDKVYTSIVAQPDRDPDKPNPLFQYNTWGLSEAQDDQLLAWANAASGGDNSGILDQIAKLDNEITTGNEQIVLLATCNSYVYAAGVQYPIAVSPPTMLALVKQAHTQTKTTYPNLVDPTAYGQTLSTLDDLVAQYDNTPLVNFHPQFVTLNKTLDDDISSLDDQVTQEKAQRQQLESQLTAPSVPTSFPDLGDSISVFDYSYISISDDDWSYTQ